VSEVQLGEGLELGGTFRLVPNGNVPNGKGGTGTTAAIPATATAASVQAAVSALAFVGAVSVSKNVTQRGFWPGPDAITLAQAGIRLSEGRSRIDPGQLRATYPLSRASARASFQVHSEAGDNAAYRIHLYVR